MDFFEHQEAARKRTTLLVVLFILALVGTVVATYFLAFGIAHTAGFVHGYARAAEDGGHLVLPGLWDWRILVIAGSATLLVIGGGTVYKINELSGGGAVIAAHLGGRIVARGTQDQAERRLLNVVEEMAIASGTPVPPVFVLNDERGINAFAAGRSPADAVIGVTRGAIETLDRDQLQGVIAHEFSHILNGDMRLNVRLIGILHGILLLSLIGQFMLRAGWYGPHGRRSRDKSVLYVVAIGVGLVIIGAIGSFFGNLIKSGVNRQREFLADASAVQFTRNPGGIAGALKKVLGLSIGSRVTSPAAPEASHMFFGQATYAGFAGLFATHPPLKRRILRIEPTWDGKIERVQPLSRLEAPDRPAAAEGRGAGLVGVGLLGASAPGVSVPPRAAPAMQRIGLLEQKDLEQARLMLDRLPLPVRQAGDDAFGAQCLVFALLIDADPVVAQTQIDLIAQRGADGLDRRTRSLLDLVRSCGRDLRLAVLDLALPSLRQLSPGQYNAFRELVGRLAAADRKLSLFEWCVQRIVIGLLDEQFHLTIPPRTQYDAIKRLGEQVRTLLSALARVGNNDGPARRLAFRAGAERVPELGLTDLNAGRLSDLASAVDELAKVAPRHKRRVIEACAATLSADREVTSVEAELFRAMAQALDVPVPPLHPGATLI